MRVFDTEEIAAKYCLETMKEVLAEKPDALFCLAAGHTSLPLFEQIIKEAKRGVIDLTNAKIVGLDEWVGIGGSDDGACERFLRTHLFDYIPVEEKNIRLFNGLADDLDEECKAVESYIEQNGGIDYMLLGVGMNGHLGLNEPGTPESSKAHVAVLDSVTQAVAHKYFEEKPVLRSGITLGITNILESKTVQVLITGERKQEIAKRIIESNATEEVPASLISGKANVEFVLDKQAAKLL